VKVTPFDRAMIATATVLGAMTALELGWPHALRVARDGTAKERAEFAPVVAQRLEITRGYSAAVDRPLFTVDRRPYQVPPDAAAQAAAATAPVPELNAHLLAVVTVAADKTILLRVGGGNVVRKLKTGETIDGWTVQRVEDARATLSHGRFERTVELTSGPATAAR
jgi:hypothetical protein